MKNSFGQYQRAIEDYNEAIRLKPNNAIAYANRCGAYCGLGQYQRAIEDCNKDNSGSGLFLHVYIPKQQLKIISLNLL